MSLVEHRVALVVPSCDKYSDLWKALFHSIDLHWPSCPFQKFLVTNDLAAPSSGVTTISVGTDAGWSANLISALSSIPHEYVLLYLDDLFLRRHVNHSIVMESILQCVSNEWDYLRLNPTPGPPRAQLICEGIGQIPPGDLYRASTVFSLWKRSTLVEVLDAKENAWELEIHGSARTDKYSRWFACEGWNLPYYNLVIKGKLEPRALSGLHDMGIELPPGRPIMNTFESGLFAMRKGRSFLMNFVPRTARRRIRSLFASR